MGILFLKGKEVPSFKSIAKYAPIFKYILMTKEGK